MLDVFSVSGCKFVQVVSCSSCCLIFSYQVVWSLFVSFGLFWIFLDCTWIVHVSCFAFFFLLLSVLPCCFAFLEASYIFKLLSCFFGWIGLFLGCLDWSRLLKLFWLSGWFVLIVFGCVGCWGSLCDGVYFVRSFCHVSCLL